MSDPGRRPLDRGSAAVSAAERTAEARSSRITWVLEYGGERIAADGSVDYDRSVGYATDG